MIGDKHMEKGEKYDGANYCSVPHSRNRSKIVEHIYVKKQCKTYLALKSILADCQHVSEGRGLASYKYLEPYKVSRTKSNRKGMNRIWSNQKANTAPETKTGNK